MFTDNKDRAVQSEILKLVNNNCPSLQALSEGPRLEQRVNLTIPVMLVSLQGGELVPQDVMVLVTKEFSSNGVSVVVDHPHVPKQAVVIFKSQGRISFMLAEMKHLDPMGAGFYQCGFQLLKVLVNADWPTLQELAEAL